MAVIKHIAVHCSPKKFLQYILKDNKTNTELVTGLNCSEDINSAYEEMKFLFEYFDNTRFSKKSLDKNSGTKETIRLHHYIQSFKPNEVTPEKAHEIGVAWARKVFGEEHQVLVTTHVDRQHIHNHFAVAAYDLKGKRWHDNKTTLKRCRDISDNICKSNGLSIIPKTKRTKNCTYTEWLERQNGTSWKDKLCDDIDKIVMREDVKTINDLATELARNGYQVRMGKYLSVKPAYLKNAKAVRTFRLGNGYALEELQYRIEYKNSKISFDRILSYNGIQREYALYFHGLQMRYHREYPFARKVTIGEVQRTSELLCFLSENNIHSKEELENIVNKAADKADELKERLNELNAKMQDMEYIVKHGDRFLELSAKCVRTPSAKFWRELHEMKPCTDHHIKNRSDIEKSAAELEMIRAETVKIEEEYKRAMKKKKELTAHYKTALNAFETDYDRIVKEQQSLLEKYEESLPKPEPPKKDFIEAVTKMSEWADKVHRKAEEQKRSNRNYYER